MIISEEKALIRKRMIARRRSLSNQERGRMRESLTRRLLALPLYQSARRVMAYLAMPGEADADLIIENALASGKEVYVPCLLDKEGHMEAGRLTDMKGFVSGSLGIRSLPAGYKKGKAEAMDIVLVPAAACDISGRRIGMGAGYYDRYLTAIDFGRRIALIWDFQLVPALPSDSFDQKVSCIITEKQIISSGRGVVL